MCCHARATTATTDSPEVAHSSVREAVPLINYVPTDREVHLGKEIAVLKRLYNHLMGLKRQTRFVHEAAVAIFYTAGLVGRSVTGAASNYSKGEVKFPLEKETYAVFSDFFNHFFEAHRSDWRG
ncbi:uncharacterized protein LOC119166774 [Rhipicephalus microplus]|uniref:uncharacterized protein LOC119166774 n=1 Tax=Rhipicephalus microplus TaxID=6941 RepID=UPI00188750F5|nr:uncharacterized protein LOC119166774 [Rhipicephalus microplus]